MVEPVKIGILRPPTLVIEYFNGSKPSNEQLEELVYQYMEEVEFHPIRYYRRRIDNVYIVYVKMEPISLDL